MEAVSILICGVTIVSALSILVLGSCALIFSARLDAIERADRVERKEHTRSSRGSNKERVCAPEPLGSSSRVGDTYLNEVRNNTDPEAGRFRQQAEPKPGPGRK